MLFVHDVAAEWRERIPAAVHVDGPPDPVGGPPDEPLVARMLEAFEQRTGFRRWVNTSLNTAGRPMVDDPATRWSVSARRLSTCWPSARSAVRRADQYRLGS